MSAEQERDTDAQIIGLLRVFTPAQAAEVLRTAGLEDMTECALRTRAYRKQIPFHLNGHRIIFTVEDLREVAEGTAFRPQNASHSDTTPIPEQPRPPRTRAPRNKPPKPSDGRWRARMPRDAS